MSFRKMLRHVIQIGANLPSFRVGTTSLVCRVSSFKISRATLMQDREPGNCVEQRWNNLWEMGVEDACSLRTSEYKQVRSDAGGRCQLEEFRSHGDPGNLSVREPLFGRWKIHGGCLNALADEPVCEAWHRIRLKGHGGNLHRQCRRHSGARCISADAEHSLRLEFADNSLAIAEA